MPKKIFILFPDGVGLRNFALTDFPKIGEARGWEVVYWNNTVFSLQEEFGFNELKIESNLIHPNTSTLSRARKRVELALSRKRTKDPVYQTYQFPLTWKGFKNFAKSTYVLYQELFCATPKGLDALWAQMAAAERKTARYTDCYHQLKEHNPDLVFSTTQRATLGIAPILAAQDLGIPTACWIYSWDNLPKGMNTVQTDFYFVWSELMKEQFLEYYPKVKRERIFITGTPQFEPHYDEQLLVDKRDFYEAHGLDLTKEYLCFTGDDITTSPLDQLYLKDLACAVEELNEAGGNYGIIFRRVPVDFSDRYDDVLAAFEQVITPIIPLWHNKGGTWNKIMPTREDFALLANIAHHTHLVANIGSSTAFDFAIHNTPCLYFDYEQAQVAQGVKGIKQCYDYVHFRSMPEENTVLWVRDPKDLVAILNGALQEHRHHLSSTKDWYSIINYPNCPEKASERIWERINKIVAHAF